MKGRALVSLAFVLALVPAVAVAGDCVDLCQIPCAKPISFADRWDDATGILGYMRDGGVRSPDWRNNGTYDREEFFDANGNGLHDPGEAFTDANGNGVYDAEAYDPWTTGYSANADLGLEIVLHPGSPSSPPMPGQYDAVALPPLDKGVPDVTADAYRAGWSSCAPVPVEPGDRLLLLSGLTSGPTNQAMLDLIGLDPDAEWDGATNSVANSDFPLSPRIFFVPVHDPRIPITSGGPNLVVRKVVAFFAERMVGAAQCRGRLLRVEAAGEPCGGGSAGGFVVACPVPAEASSWGRIKAGYR